MSVTIKGAMEFLKPSQVLYSNPLAIEVLANEIVSSMVESSIDMICDMPSEYPNKQTIEDCLAGAADMGVDFVNDAIEELREKLLKRLQEVQVKPTVKAIHFSEKGYSDIEVDIELV
jgi:hypothetical protein